MSVEKMQALRIARNAAENEWHDLVMGCLKHTLLSEINARTLKFKLKDVLKYVDDNTRFRILSEANEQKVLEGLYYIYNCS